MSEHAPGWYNDPYGRYQQRYWDGEQWTGRVATNGVAQEDPMGASTVVPFAIPPTAYTTPAGSTAADTQQFAAAADLGDPNAQAAAPEPAVGGNVVTRFLDGMGDDARLRPRPSLRTALAGIGGVLLAIGVLVALAGDESDPRGKIIGISAGLLVAALALRLVVKLPEVAAAAVGIVVVAIPTFAVAATIHDGASGVLTFTVATALFLAAWALPGFKGRNLLLGLGALTLVGVFGTLTNDLTEDKCQSYIDDGDYDRFFDECQDYEGDGSSNSFLPVEVTDNLGGEGIVYLGSAALLLGLTWWLDRRGYHGTATGTVVAGLLAAVEGTALLANKFGGSTGPILVFVVGILVCLVGAHGARRATTWWGALLAAIGAVAFIAVQWEPDSVGSIGGVAIVSGVVLIAIPLLAAPIRHAIAQQRSGDEPPSSTPDAFAPPMP
jgi:hypothetical protein